jgi:methionyl-tRNA formyltransferase
MKLQTSAVKQLALEHRWPLSQPRSLRLDGKFPEEAAAARDALLASRPQVMVVAAYGLILPQWVLDLPPHGCINIHASLLPRWRGAAPIHRALEAGDRETGITLMQMDTGLDTGAMLDMQRTDILPTDTTATLHDRLARLGGQMLVQTLDRLALAGALPMQAQPAEGITYAHKIEKREAELDWTLPASVLERRVRAFNPFPVASTHIHGETVKVWQAHQGRGSSHPDTPPGTVLEVSDQGITVLAGADGLTLTELQRAGGKRLPAADFLRGFAIAPGQRMGQP